MFKKSLILVIISFFGSTSFAESRAHYGFNAGVGIPYLTKFGLNFHNGSNVWGLEASYNFTSLDVGSSSVDLVKPELMFKVHPFAGSFFLGVGAGIQTLTAKATDLATGISATGEVTSYTLTPTIGWMFGVADGGFILGFDVGYQLPFGATTTVTSTLPATNASYADVVKQGNEYGSTAFPVITLLRLGYLF